jgi:hypothetical protein
MKKPYFTIFLFICISISAYSQEINNRDSVSFEDDIIIPITYLSLIIDPGFTMRSGAEDIISLHHGITAVEDNLIGTNWFSETNIFSKAGGIIARFAKFSFLDVPVDYFSIVFAHEYFGHGARYRELNMDGIHYAYDFPPPYGNGGGEASNYTSVSISTHQLLSIWQGGLEVHPIINRNLGMRWMANNKMTYREASQYFWSFQIAYTYVQDTEEYLGDGLDDNDPRAYTRILNANSGFHDVYNLKMTVKDLKSKFMLNVANPFIFYSIYSILKTFLWDGEISNEVPTINFRNIKYLPSLRAGLTPFGVEYHLENYLKINHTTALIDLRYGDQSFHKNWGGLAIEVKNIYMSPKYSIDFNVNLWNQPALQFGQYPTRLKGDGFGASFSARGYYNFLTSSLPISAVLELGYKSIGFVEGYNFDSTPIIIAGLALRY